jgi:hypothetical protein
MAIDLSDIVQRHLRILQLLYGSLLAAQVLLATLFVYLWTLNSLDGNEMRPFFPFAVLAITVFNIVGGRKLFLSKLSAIPTTATLDQRLSLYRQASIFRYALLEGATLFNGIAFLVMGNFVFMVVAAGIIAYFVFLRPTKRTLFNDLQLEPLPFSAAPIE